ncbi:MAG: molybdopterin-binding protein [Proteobacteria bacterium SG_bin5]|nr:MAG: molybdopterin-binding protein [Proteobacteria bacterium SG_bin5]
MSTIITRRCLVGGGALGAGLLLSGCDRLIQNESVSKLIHSEDRLHYSLQRALTDPGTLAPEYRPDQMSPVFRANGTLNPGGEQYNGWVADNFQSFRLVIDGLVNRPQSLSMAQIRSMPARTQITKHDCVEGWTAIGQWHGPTVGALLRLADVKTNAKYIVFHCADHYRGAPNPYYESLDMFDAFHPQTILAWAMNGKPVTVAHGAPLRLRAERHLGYKQAKYVTRIEAVESFAHIQGGNGGYWEDNVDYDWYGGL